MGAVRTKVRPPLLVDIPHVLGPSAGTSEEFPALVTLVPTALGVLRVSPEMGPQFAPRFTSPPALGADTDIAHHFINSIFITHRVPKLKAPYI